LDSDEVWQWRSRNLILVHMSYVQTLAIQERDRKFKPEQEYFPCPKVIDDNDNDHDREHTKEALFTVNSH
jgi:hypothetical protein